MSLLWILKPAREERRGRKSGRKGEGEEEEGGMEGGGERVEEGKLSYNNAFLGGWG